MSFEQKQRALHGASCVFLVVGLMVMGVPWYGTLILGSVWAVHQA